MKILFIMAFLAGTGFLAGCGKKHEVSCATVNPWSANDQLVSESQVIIFGSVITNDPARTQLGDLEIWKGSQEASAMGINNTMLLPLDRPVLNASVGLKAIAFLPKQGKPVIGSHYDIRDVMFVRAGTFGFETSSNAIQEFKTRYGF